MASESRLKFSDLQFKYLSTSEGEMCLSISVRHSLLNASNDFEVGRCVAFFQGTSSH